MVHADPIRIVMAGIVVVAVVAVMDHRTAEAIELLPPGLLPNPPMATTGHMAVVEVVLATMIPIHHHLDHRTLNTLTVSTVQAAAMGRLAVDLPQEAVAKTKTSIALTVALTEVTTKADMRVMAVTETNPQTIGMGIRVQHTVVHREVEGGADGSSLYQNIHHMLCGSMDTFALMYFIVIWLTRTLPGARGTHAIRTLPRLLVHDPRSTFKKHETRCSKSVW
jgi:hypothetical protein